MICVANMLFNYFCFYCMTDFVILKLDALKSARIFHNGFVFWDMFQESFSASMCVY